MIEESSCSNNVTKDKSLTDSLREVPRGKPKSGKVWKTEKKKFSSIIKCKGLKSSLKKNMTLRNDLQRVKKITKAIKDAKLNEKELKKERRKENIKRKEENMKKAEIVQVIKNPSKIKKMKRKQLRFIEKRDTCNM